MSEINRNTAHDAEKSRAFRKMGLYMALGMGTANSVVMSFTGTLVSGHFSWRAEDRGRAKSFPTAVGEYPRSGGEGAPPALRATSPLRWGGRRTT